MIYLDNNATTRVAPEVLDAMQPYLGEFFGNPSSAHALGQPECGCGVVCDSKERARYRQKNLPLGLLAEIGQSNVGERNGRRTSTENAC